MTQQSLIPLLAISDDAAQVGLFDPSVLPVAAPVDRSLDEKIMGAVEAIKAQVRLGKRLVVFWSAGKDSSVLLSLTFTALREMIAEGIQVPTLHVVHSDTQLENPVVHAYSKGQIARIERYSLDAGVPARVWVASPGLSNDYLVSVIGGRSLASVGGNTGCQQQMKAVPLARMKRKVRDWVVTHERTAGKDANLLSLIGTRRDESAVRAKRMEARGESATDAVEAMAGSGELVLSPIADFTTFDIFGYIGKVRAGKIEAYDSFDELVEIYRDMNQGDCMVTAYIAGREQARKPCSARTGCWVCTRITKDTSATNLLMDEEARYLWLKPLKDFRDYLLARHFDPQARAWLARSVDEATGKISIQPSAYSPQFTEELLGLALTIQLREEQAAAMAGIKPRFELLNMQQIIAIDLAWARYGHHAAFAALRLYRDVYMRGVRFEIPALDTIPRFTEKDVAFRAEVAFCDEEYDATFNGLRNLELATADWEGLTVTRSGQLVTHVATGSEYEVDQEGAELFAAFELDRALERFAPGVPPANVVHYFMSLGTVRLFRGSQGEWARMLKLSNQIHRHGLAPLLNDPNAILAQLSDPREQAASTTEDQLALF